VGQASEVNVAQVIGRAKSAPIGTVSEADTAQSIDGQVAGGQPQLTLPTSATIAPFQVDAAIEAVEVSAAIALLVSNVEIATFESGVEIIALQTGAEVNAFEMEAEIVPIEFAAEINS
jgi:hypothetical protein